ncbi:MAG: hypothetical protein R3B95_18095 [Nitrospirales bacterium]|nr:hypothetical protein [Nitrospirales bacterium]
MMTPYEKLKAFPQGRVSLKPGATFSYSGYTHQISENHAADRLQKARQQLFTRIHAGLKTLVNSLITESESRLIYGLEDTFFYHFETLKLKSTRRNSRALTDKHLKAHFCAPPKDASAGIRVMMHIWSAQAFSDVTGISKNC